MITEIDTEDDTPDLPAEYDAPEDWTGVELDPHDPERWCDPDAMYDAAGDR